MLPSDSLNYSIGFASEVIEYKLFSKRGEMTQPPVLPWNTIYGVCGFENADQPHRTLSELIQLAENLPAIVGRHFSEFGDLDEALQQQLCEKLMFLKDSQEVLAATKIQAVLIIHAAHKAGDVTTEQEYRQLFDA